MKRPPLTAPGIGPLVSRVKRDPAVLAALEDPDLTNVAVAQMLDLDESSIRRWRLRHGINVASAHNRERRPVLTDSMVSLSRLGPEHRQKLHDKLDAVLDSVTASPEQIKGVTVRQWENVMRGTDGEPVITRLQGIKLDVKVNEIAPDWPLIDRPAVLLKVVPPGEPRPRHPRDRVAVVLPDPQLGYRQFEDGTLDPFHDDDAIDVALQVTADLRPDRVVCLGDFQDFAEFGKYTQEAAFARTTQRGIDRGHELAGQMRAAAPDAEIDVMEGNHDRRAEKRILETNIAAWGLKRAADTTGWPVFSVPYLCAFDAFDVRYVGGYPAGELWITDQLRCIHGIKVRSGGSTAAAVVKDDGVSTIFGHVHRLELQHLTRRVRGTGSSLLAATPGCLCRVDGAVPSVKGSTGLDGRPVPSAENWQQGMAVVEYREGRSSFALHLIHIDTYTGYETRFNGRTYLPRKRRR